MTPRSSGSRHALEACTLQLHSWKPFQIHAAPDPQRHHLQAKKPCRSDRSTAPDVLDLSRLTLLDDPCTPSPHPPTRWFARKRRRRGSRSVSGRSSDRSITRPLAASAAYATCSDFPLAAAGTDSSGEMFPNGDGASWGSDASDARASREAGVAGAAGGLERDSSGSVCGGAPVVMDAQGFESGYGSEPGYRGDVEFGYGDEFDEEEEDSRLMFWGDRFGGDADHMEVVGENTFSEQKAHPRCRRKKHDMRIIAPLR